MELYRPRSSSIPRQFHRIPPHERFTVTDAVHLKLKLQALDNALSSISLEDHGSVDLKKITDACQSRPFHESVYVDGSEEFYLDVKAISRPDLIPDVYTDAYKAVLQGRPYLNRYNVSDFNKGVDPTFSEIRPVLVRIDTLCETDLSGHFNRLELKVKPFPFLQLPAELRLQVYSHLLPREAHIALLSQPHRDHKPPRLRLDMMRTSKQLHGEIEKYLYEKRVLFIKAARDKASQTLSNEYASRSYETLARMNEHTRRLFSKLEIQVGSLTNQTFTAKRYANVPSVVDPMHHVFSLLPNLETLVISFEILSCTASVAYRIVRERTETVEWLLNHVPASVQVQWDFTRAFSYPDKVEEQRMRDLIIAKDSIVVSESVASSLECLRNPHLNKFKALGLFSQAPKRL